ncbi:hypothetical protein AAG607_01405 [Citromicrobium bathyomarinum]|uniref:hypothetical protein n=1 Tax=Citromicrobium bathyomarinum TaxID=72174 RepID=UPI00315ABB29
MKYYDVFGDTGYHSAFLTTFAFTAQAFEDVPFPKLRGVGCRNVTVLADQSMLNLSLEEFGVPRFAGSLYHLAKVDVRGAFHPKITLLLGKEKGRLLVGSANLTALGIAGNKELVADLAYSRDEPHFAPLLRQAFEYIESYAPAGDPWFPVARERALALSPWLAEEEAAGEGLPDGLALLLDRGPATILEQISAAVGDDEIDRLVVMSPYWDSKLEGLRRLREAMGMPATDLLLEKSRGEFPISAFDASTGIELFDIEGEGSGRFNHAKLIVALSRESDHVVSGSVNCTIPALLGSSIMNGNAEAAIYKRVAPGTALARLGLDGYRGSPLGPLSLPEPNHPLSKAEEPAPREAGTFQLRGNRITWKPAPGLKMVPTRAHLFDRLGASPWSDLSISVLEETGWFIDLEPERPRSARVQFADGSLSAVTMVLDLDILAPSSLPSSGGKKAKVADRLLRVTHEDLELVGILTELEIIELDEIGPSVKKSSQVERTDSGKEEERTYSTLTYDDYVRARERREASRDPGSSQLNRRGDRAADLVSSCLNRLIGLVSRDLSEEEDAEFKRATTQDPSVNEPSALTGHDPIGEEAATPSRPASAAENKGLRKARADKIVDAIAAFEARSRALRGKPITTTELVRLRLLLQIVLNYAQPVDGAAAGEGTLPLADKSGHGWARLLGRLLMQHFGTFLAVQDLRLEEDENEQLRVIEYLATAYFAAKAARQAVEGHPRADVLVTPMERLTANIAQQVAMVVHGNHAEALHLNIVIEKLSDRFSERLGIFGVPRLAVPDGS